MFRWRAKLERMTCLVARTTISHVLKKHLERKLSISFLKADYPVRTNSTELSIAGLVIISTQISSGNQQIGTQESGERLTEANYNPGCVDATLGMKITDQLFYEGKTTQSAGTRQN